MGAAQIFRSLQIIAGSLRRDEKGPFCPRSFQIWNTLSSIRSHTSAAWPHQGVRDIFSAVALHHHRRANSVVPDSFGSQPFKHFLQCFKFLGSGKFTGKQGEVRYEKFLSDTYIYADVNGDKKADFSIYLDDSISLTKEFFIL